MLGSNIENAYLLIKEMILLGDYNVNFLSSTGYKQHHKATVKDLPGPCLSSWEHLNNISVIPFGMSDHLPIVATRKYSRTRSKITGSIP
ncbi:unnamed protein product [Pocillopora meandrina]|uniref:Endonuclease/exonuclease/phosphatase domain-containing protein n=1 Tax=Pocillopora meandrina TaxID=46732 RepID=A0AAU9WLR1_9CNID|nr:unnamed protein product [Pocillopora meandrina]